MLALDPATIGYLCLADPHAGNSIDRHHTTMANAHVTVHTQWFSINRPRNENTCIDHCRSYGFSFKSRYPLAIDYNFDWLSALSLFGIVCC